MRELPYLKKQQQTAGSSDRANTIKIQLPSTKVRQNIELGAAAAKAMGRIPQRPEPRHQLVISHSFILLFPSGAFRIYIQFFGLVKELHSARPLKESRRRNVDCVL